MYNKNNRGIDMQKIRLESVGAIYTHTRNLINNINRYKVKGNIIMPCEYYDTG